MDQFYLTPGLTGYGETSGAAPARALFPGEVLTGSLGREDAIAYVVTPATGDSARFAHADFIYRVDAQRITGLTIGAAIGDLSYTDRYGADGKPTLDPSGVREPGRRQLVAALGRALGAVDGNGSNAALYSAALNVIATGGGNPNLNQVRADDRATMTQAQGRAGYIVVDARAPASDESLLRLGAGIATQGLAELDRSGGTFNGYVAGIVQLDNAGQMSWLDGRESGDFSLNITSDNVAATASPRTTSETPVGTFTLGGAQNGAFISRDRFVAFTTEGAEAKLALVSSDFLAPFQGGGDPLATFDAEVPDYARWGAFLGDMIAASPSSQVVAFAPWVAGPRVAQATLPVTGSASYRGAVLGNVAIPSGGQTQTYTGGGTFQHEWSFAQRRGDFAMQFDGRGYAAFTVPASNGFDFAGQLRRDGAASQVGGLTGIFVSPTPSQAGAIPPATIGQFAINESGTFIAAGVFAGRVC